MKILRTNSEDKDFTGLVELLNSDLAKRPDVALTFLQQFNKCDKIKHVVVVYKNSKPLGCGALKRFNSRTMEVKRVYTDSARRRNGVATLMLSELSKWAAELSYEKCILETHGLQPESFGLYKKNGFKLIPNYGQYIGMENNQCFEKLL